MLETAISFDKKHRTGFDAGGEGLPANGRGMAERPTVLDLFSGCGGMSLGFEAAGFDIAASIDFDAIHCLVHHVNFPYSATICKDISKISKAEIYARLKEKGFKENIDVVVGGPPCQGFSQIGKRALDDPRNRLVFEYHRMVKELKPKYFVFENVPGIAAGSHKALLTELILEFENIGYSIVEPYRVLDAATYGTPQKRKRMILIGYRHGTKAPTYPNPVRVESLKDNHDLFESAQGYVGSAAAIADLANHDAYVGEDSGIDASKKKYMGYQKNYDFEPNGDFSLCHKRHIEKTIWGHISSNHTVLSVQRFANTKPGETEKVSRFFKLHPEKPCHTLRAGTASDRGAYTAPRPIHYDADRCITVREAARLHGFPDWFQFHRTIWHGFREIGNAVAPPLAKRVGDEIVKSLGANPEKLKSREISTLDTDLLTYNMAQASRHWDVPDDVIPKRRQRVG